MDTDSYHELKQQCKAASEVTKLILKSYRKAHALNIKFMEENLIIDVNSKYVKVCFCTSSALKLQMEVLTKAFIQEKKDRLNDIDGFFTCLKKFKVRIENHRCKTHHPEKVRKNWTEMYAKWKKFKVRIKNHRCKMHHLEERKKWTDLYAKWCRKYER